MTRVDLVDFRGSVRLSVALILVARGASGAGVQRVVGQQPEDYQLSSAVRGESPHCLYGSKAPMPAHLEYA